MNALSKLRIRLIRMDLSVAGASEGMSAKRSAETMKLIPISFVCDTIMDDSCRCRRTNKFTAALLTASSTCASVASRHSVSTPVNDSGCCSTSIVAKSEAVVSAPFSSFTWRNRMLNVENVNESKRLDGIDDKWPINQPAVSADKELNAGSRHARKQHTRK